MIFNDSSEEKKMRRCLNSKKRKVMDSKPGHPKRKVRFKDSDSNSDKKTIDSVFSDFFSRIQRSRGACEPLVPHFLKLNTQEIEAYLNSFRLKLLSGYRGIENRLGGEKETQRAPQSCSAFSTFVEGKHIGMLMSGRRQMLQVLVFLLSHNSINQGKAKVLLAAYLNLALGFKFDDGPEIDRQLCRVINFSVCRSLLLLPGFSLYVLSQLDDISQYFLNCFWQIVISNLTTSMESDCFHQGDDLANLAGCYVFLKELMANHHAESRSVINFMKEGEILNGKPVADRRALMKSVSVLIGKKITRQTDLYSSYVNSLLRLHTHNPDSTTDADPDTYASKFELQC